jgi:membrane fusion protein (multidrug efflux system)
MNFNRRNAFISATVLVLVLGAGWYLLGRSGSGSGKPDDHGAPAVLVTSDKVAKHAFVNVLEAEGTARANESIDLTAKATETIRALHFSDGQAVQAGAVVAELTATEQTADEAAATAAMREQEQAFNRTTKLAEQGYVSKAGLDSAKAALDTARAKVASLKSRMKDRAITAPFAGILGLRRVSVGSLVKPGDIITTLDDNSKIKVDFTVPESEYAGLRKGQPVHASAAAFPGRTFLGTVDSIDTRVDPTSRAVTVRAIFPNDDASLLSGMLMRVGIESNARTSLSVPEQSIVPIEDKAYVFVIKPDHSVDRRLVSTGQREPGIVEITKGLAENEEVSVEGTLKLRPGATVRFKPGKGKDSGKDGNGKSS